MLGVSLEHGLLQGVDSDSTEIMLAGLEHYLKDLVQQVFEKVKRRSSDQEDLITVEDLSMILESSPSCFVEVSGPLYRLNDVMLRNDDEPMDDFTYGGNGGESVEAVETLGNGVANGVETGLSSLTNLSKSNESVDGMHGLTFEDRFTNGSGVSESVGGRDSGGNLHGSENGTGPENGSSSGRSNESTKRNGNESAGELDQDLNRGDGEDMDMKMNGYSSRSSPDNSKSGNIIGRDLSAYQENERQLNSLLDDLLHG